MKAIRIKQGLSQEDLAHECNVDRSYISMIEVGRNEPSVTNVRIHLKDAPLFG
ncbi:helix-turn-helix domain-containing protein [Paenibacillus sp. BAC0078]